MSTLRIEREHSLGLEAARGKAEAIAARLASDFGVSSQWAGDDLELSHSAVNGRIQVEEDRVCVELKLGLMLAAMKAPIQAKIERSLDKALAQP